MAPLQGFTPATPTAGVPLLDLTDVCLGGALSADLVVGSPTPAASSHHFDFQKWDGCWTSAILDQPVPLILHHLGLQRVPVAGDGHCFFSALLICLGVAPTRIALQQFRAVFSCHMDLRFESLLSLQLPVLVTKAQFLMQLRCFSQQASYEHWGDAKCCLAFTTCYGQSVVILSADPKQKHWAFTEDACKTLFLLLDPRSCYMSVRPSVRPSARPGI